MKEKARKVKNDVLKGIKGDVGKIFKESEDAEQLIYKSTAGDEARECPGAYNPYMTHLMVLDMMQLSLLLMAKDEVAAGVVKQIAKTLEEKDLVIRRMFDDRNDRRPLPEYPYKNTADLIREMSTVAQSGVLETALYNPEEDRIRAWVTRLLKTDIMAYYLEAHEAMDKVIYEADNRIYDENNSLIHGIEEKDAECIKIISAMESILLKALIRIRPDSNQVQPATKKIELMQFLTKAIAEEDEEMIDYLARCAEAAAEFSS